jgi:hypothetical protein
MVWTTRSLRWIIAVSSLLILGALDQHRGEDHLGRLVTPVWAQGVCTDATLVGMWGYTFSGFIGLGPLSRPAAVTGWFTADGAGAFSGTEITSLNGIIFRRPFTGTYAINQNCTGTATIDFSPQLAVHLECVIVAGETELIAIQTDQGAVLSGYAKKQ